MRDTFNRHSEENYRASALCFSVGIQSIGLLRSNTLFNLELLRNQYISWIPTGPQRRICSAVVPLDDGSLSKFWLKLLAITAGKSMIKLYYPDFWQKRSFYYYNIMFECTIQHNNTKQVG